MKSLIPSSNSDLSTISFEELDYVIFHGISISPSEITFVFYDFSNRQKSLDFTRLVFKQYLCAVQRFTRNFNAHLILSENVPLENDFFKTVFLPLRSAPLHFKFTFDIGQVEV